MAVFLFGLFLQGNPGGTLPRLLSSSPSPVGLLASAILRQPQLSAYCDPLRHSDNNALRNTFEWTNLSHSLTTAPPMARTNSVMH